MQNDRKIDFPAFGGTRLMKRTKAALATLVGVLALTSVSTSHAQVLPAATQSRLTVAVAVLGSEEKSSITTASSFWRPGVVLQVEAQPPRHLGYTLELAASKANGLGTQKTNIEIKSAALGLTYLWQPSSRMEFFSRATGGFIRSSSSGRFISSATYVGGTQTGGQMQFGGGADLRLSRRFSLRVAEADYEHYFFPSNSTNLRTNIRFSAGLVVRLF